MKALGPPDSFYLRAAQGWLELGNHAEARLELENLSRDLSLHPDVLQVHWEICAAALDWNAALAVAAALVQQNPEDPLGWIHQSYCLHELKRTAEARDHLLRVVDKFHRSATIRYNLACYECQLGSLAQARQWLQKAFSLGDPKKMKQAALHDPDLEPLREEIKNL